MGQHSKAIKNYKKVLKKDINHREVLRSLTNILMLFKQYDRAIKYYKHALKQYEKDKDFLYGYSLAIFKSYLLYQDQQSQLKKEDEKKLINIEKNT